MVLSLILAAFLTPVATATVIRCAGATGPVSTRFVSASTRLIIQAQAQPNALPVDVDIQDFHLDDLTGTHHGVRIRNELVAHRGDMHQAVLVHPNIHERPEGSDIGYRSFQDHARLQIRHLGHAFFETGSAEFWARIPPRFFQLSDNISDGEFTKFVIGELCRTQLCQPSRITNQLADAGADSRGNFFYHWVRLGVHRGGIQRIIPAVDAQKPCRLFKRLRPQTRHLRQFLARSKPPILMPVSHQILCDGRIQPGNALQQWHRGCVHVHAHAIHRILDDVVQRPCQIGLIHIVLVLPHTDGFRINLY